MAHFDRPIALIPAHNEEATVGAIVSQVRELWDCPVVVIDDCSTDATARTARAAGATVLPLTIQLGAWGAIQTGLRYALRHGYRTAITLDADGQHEPESIGALLQPLATGQPTSPSAPSPNAPAAPAASPGPTFAGSPA